MSQNKIKTRIQHKHDLEVNWQKAVKFVPLDGELIIYDKEIDSSGNVIKPERVKIGDGVNNVNDLAFIAPQPDWEQSDATKADFILNKPDIENIVSVYETKDDAQTKFNEAKAYTDTNITEIDTKLNDVAYINATDNETITDVNTSPSGPASIDVTAEVGQTIIVKEVDANGKPTKWESADYQPRTHWSEPVEVLPETTCEVIEDIGAAMLPDMAISAGDNLTVKYNGTEYKCTCADMGDGMLSFGNYGVIDEENPVDTGEPFVAGKTDSGDGTLIWVCIPLDGSATFTLSVIGEVHHTVPEKYLPVFGTANVYDIPTRISDDGMLAHFEGYEAEDVFKLAKTPNTIVRLIDQDKDIVLNLREIQDNTVRFGVIWFANISLVREILISVEKNSDMTFMTRVLYHYLSAKEATT